MPSIKDPEKKVNDHTAHTPVGEWHHFDAKNRVLGRLATEVAALLIGKHLTDYAANKVAAVHVVITNTDQVVLTGNKNEQKMYRHYTGYHGGLRERSAAEQRRRDSRRLVEAAVEGMLPKNNLRKFRMRHLMLYPGETHPHLPQIGGANTNKK